MAKYSVTTNNSKDVLGVRNMYSLCRIHSSIFNELSGCYFESGP